MFGKNTSRPASKMSQTNVLDTDNSTEKNITRVKTEEGDEDEGNVGSTFAADVSVARFWLIYISIALGLFLALLETSIVATSLFHIGTEFSSLDELNWVALAYTLSYLGFSVLAAQISDILGRRTAFLGFYFIFIALSIGCGFAQTLNQLIALRAVQGLGGAGVYAVGIIAGMEIAPKRVQQFLGTIIGLIVTLASVLGPVLGGALTEYANWRWIFWINGPIGGLALITATLVWPVKCDIAKSHRRSFKQIDILGSFLLIASVVLIVFAFQNAIASQSLSEYWSSPTFLGTVLSGILSLVLLFAWSYYLKRQSETQQGKVLEAQGKAIIPALSLRVLSLRVYTSSLVNTILLGFVYIMIIFVFPLRSQVVNGKNAIIAGVLLLPMLFMNAVGIAVSVKLNLQGKHTIVPLCLAAGLTMLGTGLLTTVGSGAELEGKALGFLLFVGLGYGISIATTTVVAANAPDARDHASAQGLVAQARMLGGSLGIAASSAILGTELGPNFAHMSPEVLVSSSLPEVMLAQIRKMANDAFTKDMQICMIVSAVAVIMGVLSFRTKEQKRKERIKKRESKRLSAALTLVVVADGDQDRVRSSRSGIKTPDSGAETESAAPETVWTGFLGHEAPFQAFAAGEMNLTKPEKARRGL